MNELSDLYKFLYKIIDMIVLYETSQPIIYEAQEGEYKRLQPVIPKDLLKLKDNILCQIRDYEIKQYNDYRKYQGYRERRK